MNTLHPDHPARRRGKSVTTSALAQAIMVWGSGRQISMALAARLMAEGYDVPALERRHRP